MDELHKIRAEIDSIDKKLVELFEDRMARVLAVAEYKRRNNLPILNSSREEEVLKKNTLHLKNKEFKEPLDEFFIKLMEISKEIQKREMID